MPSRRLPKLPMRLCEACEFYRRTCQFYRAMRQGKLFRDREGTPWHRTPAASQGMAKLPVDFNFMPTISIRRNERTLCLRVYCSPRICW